MGVYKVEIVKAFTEGAAINSWMNVYHVNAASIGDAAALADNFTNAERALANDNIHFLSKRVSDPTHVEPSRTDTLGGISGDQAWGTDIIPLWNVTVVDFRDASGGRMERKYYRTGFTVDQLDGSSIDATVLANYQAVMDTLVSIVISMCSPSGDSVVEAIVHPIIGMRQLHWHRRKRPGFHRGYVPD